MSSSYLPKTVLPGLRQALDLSVAKPDMPTMQGYLALSGPERAAFDEQRIAYLINGMRLKLTAVERLARALRLNLKYNQLVVNGRRGIILTGDSGDGKTESALTCARKVERGFASEYPDYRAHGMVPVVWMEMPSNSTGKQFVRGIVSFFSPDTPPPQSWSTDRLIRTALSLLHTHHTQLVVCDETHLIASRRGMGSQGEASDVIKQLQNNSTATFLLCGINLLDGQVFGTPRGKQVTDRCDLIQLGDTTINTTNGKREWHNLVAGFDAELPLCDHHPGMLIANAHLLHEVADGSLGKLARVIHRLVGDILAQEGRRDEQVTRERLHTTLNEVARSSGLEPIPMKRIADRALAVSNVA